MTRLVPGDHAPRGHVELVAARADGVARIAAQQRELNDVISSASSTTGDDEHDPEGATIGFERAQAQALLDQAVTRLAEIDAASARERAGTYGSCVDCGADIGAERVAALPATDCCVSCARRR